MQEQILIFVILAMTAIFSVVFAGLWWKTKAHTHILSYAFWFACIAVSISMQAWIVTDFGPREVVLFHTFASAGLIALIWGVARRDGERVPVAALIAVSAGTGAVIGVARAYEVQTVVLMAQNYNAGLLFVIGAYGRWQSKRRHAADRALLIAFLILAAYSIFRPSITMILSSAMTMEEYQGSVMLTVNLAMTALLCLLMSLALIGTVIADTIERSQQEATQDALTGLPNRAAFEPMVRALIKRAMSERVPVSLIVGDIDLFKRINDTFGHSAGDAVIKTFGRVISDKIRPGDVAGRIGGEEFCIAAWNCNEAGASALADRLRAKFVEARQEALPESETISASFGVAQIRPGSNYSQAFDRADAALYKAKRAGRNRVFSDAAGVFDYAAIIGNQTVQKSSDDNASDESAGDKIVSLANRKFGAAN